MKSALRSALSWLGVTIVTIALLLLIQEIHMPAPAEADHGSLLKPYSSLARLFAATEHWQTLTETESEDDALARIQYPDYDVIPTTGRLIRVPTIVIANPIDLSQTVYKRPDPQGRRDFGALLCTFLFARDADTDNSLAIFLHDVEQVIDQAREKAETLYPDETEYYRNISHFELAIAGGKCELARIKGVAYGDDSEDPDPLIVMSCAYVAHWI